jgi:hypothetical protein
MYDNIRLGCQQESPKFRLPKIHIFLDYPVPYVSTAIGAGMGAYNRAVSFHGRQFEKSPAGVSLVTGIVCPMCHGRRKHSDSDF